MNLREMEKLTAHFDAYFGQTDSLVLHPAAMEPHIDTLLYEPTDALPYWKLVTMGASDYRMPQKPAPLSDRNEYIMLVEPSVNLHDAATVNPYLKILMEVALYPQLNQCLVSYGHSLEWEPEDGEEMVGAFLEFPQIIPDPNVLRCKLGLMKTVTCLLVVPLTRPEIDHLLEIGPEAFSEWLFPDDETAPRHFLSELHRTERF